MNIDIDNIEAMVEVPIADNKTGEAAGFSVMLARDTHGNVGYWLEREDGPIATAEETPDERELFEAVLAHVGWT